MRDFLCALVILPICLWIGHIVIGALTLFSLQLLTYLIIQKFSQFAAVLYVIAVYITVIWMVINE